MSLATRCTGCGTVFRVVQDQLRVSAGWVRCGRCGAVFNAVESLVDVAAPVAPVASPVPEVQEATRERVMRDLRRVAGPAPTAEAGSPAPLPPDALAGQEQVEDDADAPLPPSPPPPPPPPARGGGHDDEVETRFLELGAQDEAVVLNEAAADPGVDEAPAVARDDVDVEVDDPASASPATPAFVRRAERAARWQRPGVRVLLGLLALGGVVGLVWQAALMFHDEAAARWPSTAPWLARLCDVAGCTIEPPRRIAGLAVLSSTLVRDGAAGRYRIGVTLLNRTPTVVRVPALELTLSDAGGRLLVRRVLRPDELGVDRDRIGAGEEQVMEATMLAGAVPVVGYTIEIFYP